jgi:hypothetical protein
MKDFDFSKTGGLPLEQRVLNHMQNAYKDAIAASYGMQGVPDNENYIVAGCVVSGSSVSDGWMVIDGELYKFTGGANLHVQLMEDLETYTFKDTSTHDVEIDRYAVASAEIPGTTIPLADFKRLYENKVVKDTDCTYLGASGRCYRYQLLNHTRSIHLDSQNNTYANGDGFILTRIDPFVGIPHGYELMVRCGAGTGLSFVTKNSVVSNLIFNQAINIGTDQLLRPQFSTENFIGSRTGGPIPGTNFYDHNLVVFFRWNAQLEKWIEINRIASSSI